MEEDIIVRHELPYGDSYLTIYGVPLVIWGLMAVGGILLLGLFFAGPMTEDSSPDDEED